MQVEIKIDSNAKEPKAIIITPEMTDEIGNVIKLLSESTASTIITGFKETELKILEPADIIRIYSEGKKVFSVTEKGTYTMRQRLYELEEKLQQFSFVRISNSEIINLKKVKSFDLSLAGTICVSLTDGTTVYASRRYVGAIKKKLGL